MKTERKGWGHRDEMGNKLCTPHGDSMSTDVTREWMGGERVGRLSSRLGGRRMGALGRLWVIWREGKTFVVVPASVVREVVALQSKVISVRALVRRWKEECDEDKVSGASGG